MAKYKDRIERKELKGAGHFQKAFAAKFGRKGEKLLFSGIWCISEAFKGREEQTGMDRSEATEDLIKMMEEAARNCDGTKLRLLADAVEMHKLCNAHDPLRHYLLSMLPITMKIKGFDDIVIPAMTGPKTAKEVQDELKNKYQDGKAPTPKTIHEVAREVGTTLKNDKRGAPLGVPRKPVHRARR